MGLFANLLMLIMRKIVILFLFIICFTGLNAQTTYIVNSNNDVDDGVCNAAHCSLREAINASNADGTASIIRFNLVPGVGLDTINIFNGVMATISQPDLTIFGDDHPGPSKSIVVNFNTANYGGVPFLNIQNSNIRISGMTFMKMGYFAINDAIIGIGTPLISADNVTLYNCNFHSDFGPAFKSNTGILINNGDNLIFRKNKMGTDNNVINIFQTKGGIGVLNSQGLKRITIDSNIFATTPFVFKGDAGTVEFKNNLFGALDTSRNQIFLDQESAIEFLNNGSAVIHDNYFSEQDTAAIILANVPGNVDITSNRFINQDQDAIRLIGTSTGINSIRRNYAFKGVNFLNSRLTAAGNYDMFENYVERYTNFYVWDINPPLTKATYLGNTMLCIDQDVTRANPINVARPAIPNIVGVNRDQVFGTATANDSVIVYFNTRTNPTCPLANCQGGRELGRAKADAGGNWALNANYVNNSNISAYAYPSNTAARPLIASEFTPCYRCPFPIKQRLTPTLCKGDTYFFRGKSYTEANPTDSIFVKGVAPVICDSTYIIAINFVNPSRSSQTVNVCFNDTTVVLGKQIHKFHLVDSAIIKNSNNCDSVVILNGIERGYSTFSATICSNSSITVGTEVFNAGRTTGLVTIPNGSAFGCDSIIDVTVIIKNYAEEFYNPIVCPGKKVIVANGSVYDENKLTGIDTLKGASSTGCDSVVHISLTYPNIRGAISQDLCATDMVVILGSTFDKNHTSELITLPGQSFFGCDSIVQVTINLLPDARSQYKADICRGDTIIIGGEIFTDTRTMGTVILPNTAANSCDSIIDVDLTRILDPIGNFDTTLCEKDTLFFHNKVFTKFNPSDNVRLDNASFRGCDSFIRVNVQFIAAKTGNFSTTICRKKTLNINGVIFGESNPSGTVKYDRGPGNGCDSVVSVSLNFYPPINALFTPFDLLCNKANTGAVMVDDIAGGSNGYMVSVDNKNPQNYAQGMTINNLSQGNHTLTVIDTSGCDTSFVFTINNSAILSLNLPNDTTINKGQSFQIIPNLNFNPSKIVWDPSTDLSCSDCLTPTASTQTTTTYMLILEDQNGCEIKDNMTVTVRVDESRIYVPTVFSPNGDGLNDKFYPVFKFPDRTKILVFRVYDRWGELLFEKLDGVYSEDGEKYGWNGIYRGKKLDPGVYAYAIQYQAIDEPAKWKTGDITIIR